MAQDKNIGQESNPNWDDQNDQQTSGNTQQPNPQRYADANLGQGGGQSRDDQNESRTNESDESQSERHGSGFNEGQTATGYGSSQRSERENVGPLDADLSELPSQKRMDRSNQTGPGLG